MKRLYMYLCLFFSVLAASLVQCCPSTSIAIWKVRATAAETDALLARDELQKCIRLTEDLQEELFYALAQDVTQSLFDLKEQDNESDSVIG